MNNENQTEQASVSVGRDVKNGVAVAGHDNITNVTMNITQSPEKPDAPKPDDSRFLFPNYIIILAVIGLSVWWGFSIQNKLKPFEEKIYGIIVTQFKGNTDAQKNKGKEIQSAIQSTLNARFKELGISDADARNTSVLIESHEAAREYGKKYKAELVIWGDVTLQGIIPNITVVNQEDTISKVFKPETTILKDSLCHAAMAQIKDIRFPALTDEPTKLVSFVTAMKYDEQENYEKAVEYFTLSLPEQPSRYIDSSFILFSRGLIMGRFMKQYDKAIDDYTQAIQINPKFDKAYIGRGLSYYVKGEDDKAIADYNQAVQINPKNDLAYAGRGRAYADNGEDDKAIADYNRAVQINPKNDLAYKSRGDVYADKKEYDKATADYSQAISLNPKDDSAYYKRGIAYDKKDEYDKAIDDYTRSICLNLKNDSAYYNRGVDYARKGEYDKAISDYNQAISLNPKFVGAYNDMSWILATCPDKYRDGVKAIEFAQKALELKPDNSQFLDTLAAAHAEAGKFEDAVKTQEKAISLLDENNKNKYLYKLTEHLNFYKAKKPWREKPKSGNQE